jgi:hypothetical protein
VNLLIETFLEKFKNTKDYSMFNKIKLADTITNLYRKYKTDPKVCKSVFKLIGVTSKIKNIQEAYEVKEDMVESLQQLAKDKEVFTQTLFAMAGLVYIN